MATNKQGAKTGTEAGRLKRQKKINGKKKKKKANTRSNQIIYRESNT